MNYGIQSGKDVPEFPENRAKQLIHTLAVMAFVMGILWAFIGMYQANENNEREYQKNRVYKSNLR